MQKELAGDYLWGEAQPRKAGINVELARANFKVSRITHFVQP